MLKIAQADFTKDLDLADSELVAVLELAAEIKRHPRQYRDALAGKSIALLFEKPSLRTRLTFELAIQQLGGFAILQEGAIGLREPLKDVARNLDRWVDAIVARTFAQETIDSLARWSGVPVINALSDMYHPCQALADMQTIQEHFRNTSGIKLAYIGDANNVAHSLLLCAVRLGMHFAIAMPAAYQLNPAVLAEARRIAARSGSNILITHEPSEAAVGAHAIYTDVWTSMGSEHEAAQRKLEFREYQVGEDLFRHARPDAIFMHCLPAKRGEEVTDCVMESPRSIVFDQAENRLHAQKALLLMLLSSS